MQLLMWPLPLKLEKFASWLINLTVSEHDQEHNNRHGGANVPASHSNPATIPTGSAVVTNQQAKEIAENIWTEWTTGRKSGKVRAARAKAESGNEPPHGEPSTFNLQPSTLNATGGSPEHPPFMAHQMAIAMHETARELVAGKLSKRAAKGKGAANAMLLELAREFAPMAVLQIAIRLEDIAAREQKTARVQNQIRRAEES